MTKDLKKPAFRTAKIPATALVQTYYCVLERNGLSGSDESSRLVGRGR
jgi:hypothetical protein